ncbi:MAG: hypothetical protein ACP5N1_06260, partial [Candidatus Woesearchaeota archaeon]
GIDMSLAETTSIFGMNLPYFIIILLFISYIIWLKYYNPRRDLKIKNVDELLMILNIFLFIFISLAALLTIMTFSSGVSELKTDTIDFGQTSTMFSVLATTVLVGIILMLINSPPSKKYSNKATLAVYMICTAMILVAYSDMVFIWFESMYVLQRFLFIILTVTLSILTYFALSIYYISTKNVLKIKRNKSIIIKKNEPKNILITSIIFIILSFSILHFGNIAITKKVSSEITGYKIEPRIAYNYYGNNTYNRIKFGTQILSHGLIGLSNQKQFLYIDYSPYDIVVTDSVISVVDESNNTFIYDNKLGKFKDSDGKEIATNGSVFFDTSKHLMIVPYHSQNFKKIKYLYLETYYPTKIVNTNNFYESNFETNKYPCNNTMCVFQINITNHLNKSVIVSEKEVFNLYDYRYVNDLNSLHNVSLCKFVGMNLTANKQYFIQQPYCDAVNCNSGITDNNSQYIVPILHFMLYNGIITNQEISITKPIDMQIKIYVDCQE